jgi:hypothetical protein
MEKQHSQSENTEDEELSDAELLSWNDAGNSQDLPKPRSLKHQETKQCKQTIKQ